jgi:hypothetical protein
MTMSKANRRFNFCGYELTEFPDSDDSVAVFLGKGHDMPLGFMNPIKQEVN